MHRYLLQQPMGLVTKNVLTLVWPSSRDYPLRPLYNHWSYLNRFIHTSITTMVVKSYNGPTEWKQERMGKQTTQLNMQHTSAESKFLTKLVICRNCEIKSSAFAVFVEEKRSSPSSFLHLVRGSLHELKLVPIKNIISHLLFHMAKVFKMGNSVLHQGRCQWKTSTSMLWRTNELSLLVEKKKVMYHQ